MSPDHYYYPRADQIGDEFCPHGQGWFHDNPQFGEKVRRTKDTHPYAYEEHYKWTTKPRNELHNAFYSDRWWS